jgi:hypothetical protein
MRTIPSLKKHQADDCPPTVRAAYEAAMSEWRQQDKQARILGQPRPPQPQVADFIVADTEGVRGNGHDGAQPTQLPPQGEPANDNVAAAIPLAGDELPRRAIPEDLSIPEYLKRTPAPAPKSPTNSGSEMVPDQAPPAAPTNPADDEPPISPSGDVVIEPAVLRGKPSAFFSRLNSGRAPTHDAPVANDTAQADGNAQPANANARPLHNKEMAGLQLNILDPNASKFTFQFFSDNKDATEAEKKRWQKPSAALSTTYGRRCFC